MSDFTHNADTGFILRCLTLTFVLLLAAAPAARAMQVVDARVTRSADRYEVEFTVLLDVAADGLASLLTHYERFTELSPTVTSSRIIRGPGGDGSAARLELKLHPCVLVFFCRTVVKVSDVFVHDGGRRLEFVAVPALSDFHEAREVVSFREEPGGEKERVRFTYSAGLKPKFYVPPLVGPWLVRHRVLEDLRTTSRRVERILGEKAAGNE